MGKVVDFSHHQGNVNWAAASKELDLAIIRVQYGSTTIDRQYKNYVEGAKNYGVPFGHYAYGRFVSVADARVEANDFLKRIDKDAKFLVLDTEVDTIEACGPAVVAEASQAFIDVCKAAGYKVGFYVSHHLYKKHGLDKVKADFLWLPRYGADNGQPSVKPDWPCDIWQYTQKGKIAGVAGYVDLNVLNKPLSFFIGEDKKQEPVKEQPKQDIDVHVVKSGDTLSEIAAKYNTTVAALVSLNGIDDKNVIHVGQKIKLKGSAPKPSKTAPSGSTYKIKSGDTFWEIEKANGWATGTLEKLNPSVNPKTLQVGQTIKTPGAAKAPSKPAAPKEEYYTVKSGDILGRIAQKYNTTVAAIDKLNKGITNVNKIYPGQKIRVK